MTDKKHVIIIGAGFGGLQAVKILGNKKDVTVTIIDKTNHHLFQPLLYQIASAVLSPADIAIPVRLLTENYENVTIWRLAKEAIFTANVDAENQTLINHKCVCGALNRHFCQTAVLRSPFFLGHCLSVHCRVVIRCLGSSLAVFCLCFCALGKTANVQTNALAFILSLVEPLFLFYQLSLIIF